MLKVPMDLVSFGDGFFNIERRPKKKITTKRCLSKDYDCGYGKAHAFVCNERAPFWGFCVRAFASPFFTTHRNHIVVLPASKINCNWKREEARTSIKKEGRRTRARNHGKIRKMLSIPVEWFRHIINISWAYGANVGFDFRSIWCQQLYEIRRFVCWKCVNISGKKNCLLINCSFRTLDSGIAWHDGMSHVDCFRWKQIAKWWGGKWLAFRLAL